MGNVSLTNLQKVSVGGDNMAYLADYTMSASYATGGDSLVTTELPFQNVTGMSFFGNIQGASYFMVYDATAITILAYVGSGGGGTTGATSGGTPAGTNGTSAVTGTGTFVGTSSGSLDLATPAFSGTGFATAGQVVTTTDNQTMTLNECAGMWLIADALASTAPVLIVSNTAVTGAPAVLTVIGTAPATDAGTYKIVKNILPTGSVTALSGTAAAQTFTGSALATHTHTYVDGGVLAEVTAATDLSAVSNKVLIFGRN